MSDLEHGPEPTPPVDESSADSAAVGAGDNGSGELDYQPGLFSVVCESCGAIVPVTPESSGFLLSQPSNFLTCAVCQGMGEVATGSVVAAYAKRPCPACLGAGYLDASSGEPLPPLAVAETAAGRGTLGAERTPALVGARGEEPPWPGAQADASVPGGWR